MSLLQALLVNLGSIVVPGILLYGLLIRLATARNKRFGVGIFAVFVTTLFLLCLLQVLALDVFPPLPKLVDEILNFAAYLGLAFVLLKAVDLLLIEAALIDKKGLYFPRILRLVIIAIGLVLTSLVLLRTVLGINVVALVAVPTVLTAVLGFALKDTLDRIVSGITLGRLIHDGDWVTLLGNEGKVANITLGYLTLTTREGDAVIIPNNMVAHNQIQNHSRPFERFASMINVEAGYAHPPLEVRRILVEAARAVQGVLTDPTPISFTQAFKDSGIEYILKFWIRDFGKRDVIESEVRSYVWYAFQRHGIEIPFPQRVIRTAPTSDGTTSVEQRIAAIQEQLHGIDFLAALHQQELAALARSVATRTFLPRESIVRQGDTGDEFFIITSGEAEVLIDAGGAQTQVATLKPGQFFGEMALLTGEPRSATVRALTQMAVLVVSKPAMGRIFQADPAVIEQISAILAQRQYQLSAKRDEAGRTSAVADPQTRKKTLGTRIRKFFGL
ncbi:MAG TPA: mechanosensitive ion channel family protein [Candidatus Acidoferrum sp.]|nr:mechanosensitive ion channel family protein [Candidatus Acidoferrum sp.]